jgi:hypothetical protein
MEVAVQQRTWFSIGLAVVTAALMQVGAKPLAAQAGAAAARTPAVGSAALKTPWGDPNLQGLWSNMLITPLERPRDLGLREFLTDQEVADREKRAIQTNSDEARGADPRADLNGAYNDVFWERGTKDVKTKRTSLIIDPKDGRIPWRPEVQKANQERGQVREKMLSAQHPVSSWLDVDTGERCITDGIPWTPYAYNNNYEIVQSPGYVAILHEQFRELRVIPIGARPQGATIPQWFGNSYGRWEGATLVIETDHFADKSSYWWPGGWRSARPSYHLVERFTRTDADTLMYEFTVTDPTMFTASWTAQTPWTIQNGRMFEYACHEGNQAMPDMIGNKK